MEKLNLFKLNQKSFHYYLKRFPEHDTDINRKPIVNKFIEGVGRKPTEQELKKYFEIIIMPTGNCELRRKQMKSLYRLIKKNNGKRERKRYKNTDQLYVG